MLSSSPTVVQEDIIIDLPEKRDQLTTRSLPRFVELRNHVYEQIQIAKKNKGAATTAPVDPRVTVPHAADAENGLPSAGEVNAS